MHCQTLRLLRVRRAPGRSTIGLLIAGDRRLAVALGRGSVRAGKREGDGATPRGAFTLVRLWWRAEHGPRPRSLLAVRRIGRHDAWCEDPKHACYNRLIRGEQAQGGDRLWRPDELYDLLIELDYNCRPRIAGRGSAIFIHVARQGLPPTAGCIALPAPALRQLLPRLGPATRLLID